MAKQFTRSVGVLPLLMVGISLLSAWAWGRGRAGDPMPEGSFWTGSEVEPASKENWPMSFYVVQRVDDTFEALSWFPTVNAGVVKVSGQIEEQGSITLHFYEVVSGAASAQKYGVVAGAKYKAKINNGVISGAGKHTSADKKKTREFTLRMEMVKN